MPGRRRRSVFCPALGRGGGDFGHITGGAEAETYQPMNVDFGLMPLISGRTKKADRKGMYTDRARIALKRWQPRAEIDPVAGDGGGIAVETSGAAFSGSPTS